MERDKLLSLVQRVSQGDDPKRVVAEIAGVRGRKAPTSFAASPKRQDTVPITEYLGELRPKDQFFFVSTVPYREIAVGVAYTVIPANRGWIGFTDGSSVFYIQLRESFNYSISPAKDPGKSRRVGLLVGDRVSHIVSKALGRVIGIKGEVCWVEFDDSSLNTEEDNTSKAHHSLLDLEEKDTTTNRYIQKVGDSLWKVSFARYEKIFESQRDALSHLKQALEVGFLRFSKLAASAPEVELELRSLGFLMTIDPKVWGRPTPFIRRGVVPEGSSMDDVRRAVLPDYK